MDLLVDSNDNRSIFPNTSFTTRYQHDVALINPNPKNQKQIRAVKTLIPDELQTALSLNSGGSRRRARYQIKALDETKPTPLTPHQSEFGRASTLSYNIGGKFVPETKISLNHIPVSYSNKQQQKQ